MIMKCERCGSTENVQESHIIPKSVGNPTILEDGEKSWLCKKCHDIYEKTLLKVVWKYIPNKKEAKTAIRNFTRRFIKNG